MIRYFGPDGRLAGSFPGYEHREPQAQMAETVSTAIKNQQRLIIEAGTGVGKTLAYLIPIYESGQAAVISTATKVLQHQLLEKDIPLVEEATGQQRKVVILKGRNNYLCLLRQEQFASNPLFDEIDGIPLWNVIKGWAPYTETGDFTELDDIPSSHSLLSQLNADRNYCTGSKCPHFRECFFFQARRQAMKADIVLVNHHLLFADLTVKETNYGTILPLHPILVLDEAHKIEDVASGQFGEVLTARSVAVLLAQLPSDLKLRHAQGVKELLASEAFHGRRGDVEGRGRITGPLCEQLQELGPRLDAIAKDLKGLSEDEFELKDNLLTRINRFTCFLESIQDPEYVSYYDMNGSERQFRSVPIDISPRIEAALCSHFETIILTSATLSVRRKMDFYQHRIGLADAESMILDSTFDFSNNALLYVPDQLPDVNDSEFKDKALEEILALVEETGGRTFVLCTSHRNVEFFASKIRELSTFNVFKQGESSPSALISRFTLTKRAVLVGSFSFWEGVDVKGEALSCVIIDRLPFPQPEEPVFKARSERMKNSFYGYSVPLAVLQFKQGLGRLIRGKTDRGVLVVLDNRIVKKNYGRIFLDSFYSVPLVRQRTEVKKFLAQW